MERKSCKSVDGFTPKGQVYIQKERQRREKRAHCSSQHVVGEGPQTPPVYALSMASLLEDFRCPVCWWEETDWHTSSAEYMHVYRYLYTVMFKVYT